MAHTEYLNKVVVLGDVGTGKSAFIKRYVHGIYSPNYKSTVGVDFALKVLKNENDTHRLQLWDIAGQERFGSMTRTYYNEATGCFVLLDYTRRSTWNAALVWLNDFQSKVQLAEKMPRYLIINKIDLLESTDNNDELIIWLQLNETKFSKVFKVSCYNTNLNTTSLDSIFLQYSNDVIKFVNENPLIPKNDINDKSDKNNVPINKDSSFLGEIPDISSQFTKYIDDGFASLFGPKPIETNPKMINNNTDITENNTLIIPTHIQKFYQLTDNHYLPLSEAKKYFAAKLIRNYGINVVINSILMEIMKNPERMEYIYNSDHQIKDKHLLDAVQKYFHDLDYTCTKSESFNGNSIIIKW